MCGAISLMSRSVQREALGACGYITNVKVSAEGGPGCVVLHHQCQGQCLVRQFGCYWCYITNVKVSAREEVGGWG